MNEVTKTITVTFSCNPKDVEGINLRYLLMDALYEFQGPRQNPQHYVDLRYPHKPEYDWLDREKKVHEVGQRIRLAEAMRCGQIDISKEGD